MPWARKSFGLMDSRWSHKRQCNTELYSRLSSLRFQLRDWRIFSGTLLFLALQEMPTGWHFTTTYMCSQQTLSPYLRLSFHCFPSSSSTLASNCSEMRGKNSVLFSLTDKNSFQFPGIFTFIPIFLLFPLPLASRVAFLIESTKRGVGTHPSALLLWQGL